MCFLGNCKKKCQFKKSTYAGSWPSKKNGLEHSFLVGGVILWQDLVSRGRLPSGLFMDVGTIEEAPPPLSVAPPLQHVTARAAYTYHPVLARRGC